MKTSSNKKFSRRNDRKVLMAEESTKSWADSDSETFSTSSSSSDSEQEKVHCFIADQTDDDEVFDFANTEFTREDLVQALNDMVHEYKTLSHTFEEIKAENASLKNSSAESSSYEHEDTDSLKTELSRLKIENDLLRNEASELKAEVDKLTEEMSSWNKSTRSLFKLYESQKPLNDKTGMGFNYDNSHGETSTQSQPVYDKFNERNLVKGGVIHDCIESIRYDDQDTSQLDRKGKGKVGVGYYRPEFKVRLAKEQAEQGQSESSRGIIRRRQKLNGQETSREGIHMVKISNQSSKDQHAIFHRPLWTLELEKTVSKDVEPIQFVDPTHAAATFPSPVLKQKSRKRRLVLSRGSDDESMGTKEIVKDDDAAAVASTDEADIIIAKVLEETLELGVNATEQEGQVGDEALFEEDFARWLDEFVARHNEPELVGTNNDTQAERSINSVVDKEVNISVVRKQVTEKSMPIDDLLIQISDDLLLPITALEITKIRLGEFLNFGDGQRGDLYSASLPRISSLDKGKGILVEDEQVRVNPAREIVELICTDVAFLVNLRDQIMGLMAPVGTIFGDLFDIKKKQREQDARLITMDKQIAAIRNEHLDFQSKIAADILSLYTQVGDIADFLRGGAAKKGEMGSSSRPTAVRAQTQTLPPTTGTFEERVAQARRHIIETGQVISIGEAAERVIEADRRESDRLERERRERRQSRSETYKRRR
ncbi:hypothetical protein F511_35636 [Dorcoceras hygrometricum]|uniref:Uncharacterized protein n=1 Tax=Dorcoceras hygrometricum TaxID=472368 RepID=A0A2Z7B0L1_9LAMI|nr:hypothetical protein F511_35636 [Dorcoceras hygrometricum]